MASISDIQNALFASKPSFDGVSCGEESVKFERELEFVIQSMEANKYLLDEALKNIPSVVNAFVALSAIGISLSPQKKHAYLVPRDRRIVLDISYMGLIDIAVKSGSIAWAQADVVHQNDQFQHNGAGNRPHHPHNPFSADRGPMVGVYVVAKTADGDYLTTCMTMQEINDIKSKSKSASGPWLTFFVEMSKKACFKRAQKTWPKCGDRIDRAVHYLNLDAAEGIELPAIAGKPAPKEPNKELLEKWMPLIAATKTRESLGAIWKNATKEFEAVDDRAGYAILKASAADHAKLIDQGAQQ